MITRTKKVVDILKIFSQNALAHPGVFARINGAYNSLPEADQERISAITSQQMGEAEANMVMTIIDDAQKL